MKRKVTNISRIVRILACLVRQPITEMVNEGLFESMETRPIDNFYCKHNVRINGRKWLAPLYRPTLGTIALKPGTFLAVRSNGSTYDLEYVDSKSKESVTYTVAAQEWREKRHYFYQLPPHRFKGSIGDAVRHLNQLKRSIYESDPTRS